MNTRSLALTCRFGGNATYSGIGSRRQSSNSGTSSPRCQVRPGHVVRQPEHAQAGQAGREVGIAVVDREHVAALHLDALAVAVHGVGKGLAGARPQEADDAVVRVFQLARVRGRAGARQVAGAAYTPSCRSPTRRAISDWSVSSPPRTTQSTFSPIMSTMRSLTPMSSWMSG
jgi:hypothetical protein